MSRGKSPRKSDQRGVEAIFSQPKDGRRTQILVGVLVVLAGIALVTISVVMVQFPDVLGRSAVESYGSMAFASFGVFALTCGGGIITVRFSMSRLASSSAKLNGNSAAPGSTTNRAGQASAPLAFELSNLHLRLAVLVFLQGCILLSLYTGLVDEYQSNPTMQEWVHASLADAHYLLNWVALLVSSFLVGILVIYSLVARDLVE